MYSYSSQKTINNTYPRIYIGDYVRNFRMSIREKEGRIFKANDDSEIEYMKNCLNNPKYTTFKSIRDFQTGIPHWHEQKVDYAPSNLGRGYIFYFVCNGCNRRVKHLYEYSMLESPVCRICCGLKYQAPTTMARKLSVLLRKPYFTFEDKQMIMRRAGITREDISSLAD
jgi:hypothetical protein